MGYGLLGFKALVYREGSNYSFMHNERWNQGVLTAHCFKPRSEWPYTMYICDIPERRCRCGIYAVAPEPEKAIEYVTTREIILAVVRAHRKTVCHQRGWRAGMAEIVAVIRPEVYWFSGVYYPHLLPVEVSVEAACRASVPLIDMVTARALVGSSWQYYRGRLQ